MLLRTKMFDEAAAAGTTGEAAVVEPQVTGAETSAAVETPIETTATDAGVGAAPAIPDVFSIAEQAGYDLRNKYRTPEEAVQGLVSAQRMLGQRDEDAQWAKQYRQHESAINEMLRRQQEPQRQATDGPPEQPNPLLFNAVQRDPQTGRWVPLAGYPQAYADKINQYYDYVREQQLRQSTDPLATIKPMREEIVNEVREMMQQEFAQQEYHNKANRIVSEISPWAFARGANGQMLRDPQSGQPSYTPAGRAYYSALAHVCEEYQISDPEKQHAAAMMYLRANAAQVASPEPSKPTNPVIPPGAGRAPNTGAGVDPTGKKPRQQSRAGMSLNEKLMAAANEIGLTDDHFQQ